MFRTIWGSPIMTSVLSLGTISRGTPLMTCDLPLASLHVKSIWTNELMSSFVCHVHVMCSCKSLSLAAAMRLSYVTSPYISLITYIHLIFYGFLIEYLYGFHETLDFTIRV